MATKKTTTKKTSSGLKITSTGFSDSKGSYDTAGRAVTNPTPAKSSAPTPTRYTSGNSGSPTPSNSFGFMDGSSYSADGSQIKAPSRYTAPINEIQQTDLGVPSISKPILGKVNESKIRNDVRRRMQGSIDAINANYANLISQERVQGEDRSGQTRALNARSGTIGSDFGHAAQEKTTQYNQAQQQYLVDQQNAQVQAVMNNIEDRASAEIKMRKDEAMGKYQIELHDYEQTRADARLDFETLAKSGVDLGTLAPNQKAALFRQAGYEDDAMAELVFNAMKPKPQQIDYQFAKMNDGTALFYGVDPQTGELKTQKLNVDIPPNFDVTFAPDGTMIGYDKNSGVSQVLGNFADPTKQTSDIQNYNAAVSQGFQGSFIDFLNMGGAGSISPDVAAKLGLPAGTSQKDALPFIKEHNVQVNAAKDAIPRVDEILGLIQSVYNHQGMKGATGVLRLGGLIPGTHEKEFIGKFDQLKATLSLDSIKYLKGTGAISDAEQQLLANAASSLRRDMSTSGFKAELERIYNQTLDYKKRLVEKSTSGQLDTATQFEEQYGGSEGTNPKASLAPSTASGNKLTSVLTGKFPEGSVGGQCGDFARKLANSMGVNYPRLGNSLTEKTNAVKKYGTSLNNAAIGSVIVTKENPTYGHVATIIGRNANGYVVAESNFKQSNKISYGRTIPFKSTKIIGIINPNPIG